MCAHASVAPQASGSQRSLPLLLRSCALESMGSHDDKNVKDEHGGAAVAEHPAVCKRELVDGDGGPGSPTTEVASKVDAIDKNIVSSKEKRRLRGVFYRSLEQNDCRSNRMEKCTAQLALCIKSDPRGMGYWFNVFMEEDRCWNKVELRLKQVERNTKTIRGVVKWLTYDRMVETFHSATVCDAMVKHCKQCASRWRVNKNAPDCEAAIEYKIYVDSDEIDEHVNEDEIALTGAANLSAAAGSIIQQSMSGAPGLPAASKPAVSQNSLPWMPLDTAGLTPAAAAAIASVGFAEIDPDAPQRVSSDSFASPQESAPPGDRYAGFSDKEKAALIKLEAKERDKLEKRQAKELEKEEVKKRRLMLAATKKAEDDRIKALATSKAARWSNGLAKDISLAQDIVDKVANEKLSQSQIDDFKQKFQKWCDDLKSLKSEMRSCSCQDHANSLLEDAPNKVRQFHLAVKNYKKALVALIAI